MGSNVDLRTAASLVDELANDVEEYGRSCKHDPRNDDGSLLNGLIGAGVEEVRIRRQFGVISQKVAQIIALAGKMRAAPTVSGGVQSDSLIADAYYYMGHAHRLRSNWRAAQLEFEKSLQAYANPDAKYFLGVVLEAQGQKRDAREVFKSVVDVFPDSDRAVEANKRLLAPATSSSGCFVATVCFGSFDAPEVRLLRGYRDTYLAGSKLGRLCTAVYYKIGPSAAAMLERYQWLRRPVRKMILQPLVCAVGRHCSGLNCETKAL
jgi:tetratricopeptide (TPR) repeat protein